MRAIALVVLAAATAACGKDPAPDTSAVMKSITIDASPAAGGAGRLVQPAERGGDLIARYGCDHCHSTDGSVKVGPSFQGLWDRTQSGRTKLADGRTLADVMGPGKQFPTAEDYLRAKMLTPQIVVVAGYTATAPGFAGQITDDELHLIIAFLRAL